MARLSLLAACILALLGCDQTPNVEGSPLPLGPHRTAERKTEDSTDRANPPPSDDGVAKPVTPAPATLPPATPITPTPAPSASSSSPAPTPAPKPTVTAVDVHWSRKSSTAEYSFDIETITGELIGPCIDVGTVGQSLSVRYSGVCTSPGRDVPLTEVAKVRVCWTEGGDWSKASCAAMPYDATEADVTIPN